MSINFLVRIIFVQLVLKKIDDQLKQSKIDETLKKVKELKSGYDEILQAIKEEEEMRK